MHVGVILLAGNTGNKAQAGNGYKLAAPGELFLGQTGTKGFER